MSDLLAWPILSARGLRLSLRNVDGLLIALILPIMLMLMFVYLFGGAIQTGTDYVTYVLPGVLVLCAGYGASLTAVAVSEDMKQGIVDRLRSMDIGGRAVLAGHVTASALRNLCSIVAVFAVAFLIGFRSGADLTGWLATVGLIVAYIVAMSTLSALVGLMAKTPEAASGFTFFVLFLPYPSSAFVPIETMPSWLHGFAEHQPVTPIIESVRGLLLGTPVGSEPWTALTWCGAIIALSVGLSGVLFARRTR